MGGGGQCHRCLHYLFLSAVIDTRSPKVTPPPPTLLSQAPPPCEARLRPGPSSGYWRTPLAATGALSPWGPRLRGGASLSCFPAPALDTVAMGGVVSVAPPMPAPPPPTLSPPLPRQGLESCLMTMQFLLSMGRKISKQLSRVSVIPSAKTMQDDLVVLKMSLLVYSASKRHVRSLLLSFPSPPRLQMKLDGKEKERYNKKREERRKK